MDVGLPTSQPVTLAARRLVRQPTSPIAAQGTLAGRKRTLIDFLDVTLEQVQQENHGGVGCVCTLCRKLKNLEDTWMMRLGTFYHPGGLNKRDEIKRKVGVTIEKGLQNFITLSVKIFFDNMCHIMQA